MTRRCDGCTACCFLPEQRELDKPADTWCQHCTVGTGCGIYKQRPQGCKDFECLWLANPAIPDELRPDRVGVVFEALAHSRTCLALVDPRNPGAWRDPGPMHIIANLLRHGTAVVVTRGGKRVAVMLPKGATTKQVLDDIAQEVAAR